MSSNIFPEKVVRTRGDDGTNLTSEVYTLEAWANLSLINLIIMLILVGVMCPFIPLLFLGLYCFMMNRKPIPNSYNFFGAATAAYLLYDFHKEWIFSSLIKIFSNAEQNKEIFYLNIGLFLTHVILLFFGGAIFRLCGSKRRISVIVIFVMTVFTYYVGRYVIHNNIINI